MRPFVVTLLVLLAIGLMTVGSLDLAKEAMKKHPPSKPEPRDLLIPDYKLNVTITKTSDGKRHYIQIMSADMVSTNVVLVADEIVLEDRR